MKKIFPTVVIVLLICIAIVSQINKKKSGKTQYEQFYNCTISGKIQAVRPSVGTTYIIVDDVKYGFYPKDISKNGSKIFYRFAEYGDSIYKPAQFDTLKLIKKDKEYLFTFKKFR
jgi:hypothetical protein